MRGRLNNLIGQTFGRLTVIERMENDKHARARWRCRCSCGKEVIVSSLSLVSNRTKSCGCYKKEATSLRTIKHGLCKNPKYKRLYQIWADMKFRCSNSNACQYHFYGSKGITVCREWAEHFEVFAEWALTHGYAPNLTIDRIDSNKNYCPENCQWLTRADNARKAVKITNFKRWGYVDG